MNIVRVVGRRLVEAIPVLALVSVGMFLLMQLVPGDPATTLAGGPEASPERITELRDQLGLDDPLVVQYSRWAGGAIRGDFGTSISSRASVTTEIADRLPATLSLAFGASLVALVVGIGLGLTCGFRAGTKLDSAGRVVASAGVAIPSFWLGPLLVIVFAVQRDWLPASGYVSFTESPLEWVRTLVLPSVTLGLVLAAFLARQLRGALVEVLESNYVRTLWASGAGWWTVSIHALRNAAIPAVTIFGMQVAALIGGTVIVEQIFSIPGLGSYMLRAVQANDLPVIQGAAMFFVVVQVTVSLLVDVAYGVLNPKVRVR